MGEIRTPRPIYKNQIVVEFLVIEKQLCYKILKWIDDGWNQSLLEHGLVGDKSPQQIIDYALQNFSSVSRQ